MLCVHLEAMQLHIEVAEMQTIFISNPQSIYVIRAVDVHFINCIDQLLGSVCRPTPGQQQWTCSWACFFVFVIWCSQSLLCSECARMHMKMLMNVLKVLIFFTEEYFVDVQQALRICKRSNVNLIFVDLPLCMLDARLAKDALCIVKIPSQTQLPQTMTWESADHMNHEPFVTQVVQILWLFGTRPGCNSWFQWLLNVMSLSFLGGLENCINLHQDLYTSNLHWPHPSSSQNVQVAKEILPPKMPFIQIGDHSLPRYISWSFHVCVCFWIWIKMFPLAVWLSNQSHSWPVLLPGNPLLRMVVVEWIQERNDCGSELEYTMHTYATMMMCCM